MAVNELNIPRIIIAAPHSGSGKTTVTCGILKALTNMGKKVASFKCGPDYIDPMFHSEVLGIPSRNLDLFFTDENITKYLLYKNSQNMDISVIEGVMGYYDGLGGTTHKASSYDLARATKTPAILLIDSKGKSLSILAEIKGFMEYREDSNIKGVILNRMSPMIYPGIKKLIEEELGIKVLGYVPVLKDCSIESRHLGLVTAKEIGNLQEIIQGIASEISKTVDLEELIDIGKRAQKITFNEPGTIETMKKVKIGVAMDKAFCFYYKDNLELLESLGGELIYFSPIKDEKLPEGIKGLIFGGGYPELYLPELRDNLKMKSQIKDAINEGIPVLAECGGFMYLHDWIQDEEGNKFEMVGAINGGSYPTGKLGRFGYINIETRVDSVIGKAGTKMKGHEFHYWDSENTGNAALAKKPVGKRQWECIVGDKNIFAGYPHIHFYSNLEIPKKFIEKARGI